MDYSPLSDRADRSAATMARSVGWLSLGLCAAELVAPGRIARAANLTGEERRNVLIALGLVGSATLIDFALWAGIGTRKRREGPEGGSRELWSDKAPVNPVAETAPEPNFTPELEMAH